MVHRRSLVAIALAVSMAGCAQLQSKDRKARLSDSLTAYVGAIRWGNYETAAAFAVPREARTTPVDPATLTGLRVTGYSIRVNRVNEAGDEAAVSLSFTYYQQARGTVNTVTQDATWYYDDSGRGWLLDDTLPRFKR
jgi:hypothetical protein